MLFTQIPFEASSFDLWWSKAYQATLILLEILAYFNSILNLAFNRNNDRVFPNNYKVYLSFTPSISLHNVYIAHLLIKSSS